MNRKLALAEIAALEERLRLNAERMGVHSLRELQATPVIQKNLAVILAASFAAGLGAGLISRTVNDPIKKMLPFLLRL